MTKDIDFPELTHKAVEFMTQMESGPADGEMDILWQETGKGYYVHLHNLGSLAGEEQKEYLAKLIKDIEKWRSRQPDCHMVENVAKFLQNSAELSRLLGEVQC